MDLSPGDRLQMTGQRLQVPVANEGLVRLDRVPGLGDEVQIVQGEALAIFVGLRGELGRAQRFQEVDVGDAQRRFLLRQ
jgi:hypothetical protein